MERRGGRGLKLAIALLLVLFVTTIWQRDRIRAQWWATRLMSTDDLPLRGQYLALIGSVGERAAGAVSRMADDTRPDVRLLSVFAASKLPQHQSHEMLGRLVLDSDADVREAAGRALAFDGDQGAIVRLCAAATNATAGVAADALASLARSASPLAAECILNGFQRHLALLRAQAAESAVVWLENDDGCKEADSVCRDLLLQLVERLTDPGEFEGRLSLEREIDRASAFMRSRDPVAEVQHRPPNGASRKVADIAAAGLSRLAGRPVTSAEVATDEGRLVLVDFIRTALAATRRGSSTPDVPINLEPIDPTLNGSSEQRP